MTQGYAALLAQVIPVVALAAIVEIRSLIGRLPALDRVVEQLFSATSDRDGTLAQSWALARGLGAATILSFCLIGLAAFERQVILHAGGYSQWTMNGLAGGVSGLLIIVLSIPAWQTFYRVVFTLYAIFRNKPDDETLPKLSIRRRIWFGGLVTLVLCLSLYACSNALVT